jgi:hypothetical protein
MSNPNQLNIEESNPVKNSNFENFAKKRNKTIKRIRIKYIRKQI